MLCHLQPPFLSRQSQSAVDFGVGVAVKRREGGGQSQRAGLPASRPGGASGSGGLLPGR